MSRSKPYSSTGSSIISVPGCSFLSANDRSFYLRLRRHRVLPRNDLFIIRLLLIQGYFRDDFWDAIVVHKDSKA
jgi:hypothetical protein